MSESKGAGWKAMSSVYGRIEEILLICRGNECKDMPSESSPFFQKWRDDPTRLIHVMEGPSKKELVKSEPELQSLSFGEIAMALQGKGYSIDTTGEKRTVESMNNFSALGRFKKLAVVLNHLRSSKENHVHSMWAQDPFVVLEGEGDSLALLQSIFLLQRPDVFISMFLPELLQRDMLIRPTTLHIEGGNLLVGDDFAFVGADLLAKSMSGAIVRGDALETIKQKWDAVVERMRKALGVETLYFVGMERGNENWSLKAQFSAQPIFHIDYFMTLGGKTAEGKDLVFLGDPVRTHACLRKKGIRTIGGLPLPPLEEESHRLSHFKAVKHWLKSHGRFEVVDFPILLLGQTIYSYNNCLMEVYRDAERKLIREAWLPQYRYGSPETNSHYECFTILNNWAAQILNDHGFKANFVESGQLLYNLASQKGSLNCLTKVLHRKTHLDDFIPPK